ncbi:hypothetical protein F2Q69_00059713 [Brassica cretica]|uniref:Uncharacterized protein n=1 Tax=Brassica cretica TaxID=69181 RepID=A0A8S9RJE8_BRACR|nr:hypothetical protein F2Q69_00059713 [Brassica cretica]
MTEVLGFAAFHVWRSRGPRCALGCTGVLGSFDNILKLAQTHSCFMSHTHYRQYLALYVRIPHGSRLLSRSTIFDRVGVENGYDEVNVQISAEYKWVSIDMNSPTKDLWTFVSGPEAVYNPEVFYEPGGCFEPGGHLGTRRFLLDPKVILNLEVVWEPGGSFWTRRSYETEGHFEPGGCLGTRRFLLYPKVVLNPKVSFGPGGRFEPGGTVLRLPRQDNSRYLFGFRIMPLGSWPLSSSYAVFYFCRKSLTGLEGAGVGVMTQVLGFAAFHHVAF